MRFSPIDELRRGAVTFEDTAAPPTTLRADTLVSDAVDRFRDEHHAPALVSDADEGTAVGLTTATDALEAVTGEIEDPLDVTHQERGNASR